VYRLSILVHKLQHLRAVRSSEVIKLTVTVIHTQIIGAEVCTVIYKKIVMSSQSHLSDMKAKTSNSKQGQVKHQRIRLQILAVTVVEYGR